MHIVPQPDSPIAEIITFDQFQAVDMRVGTIISAEFFQEARKPSLKLKIDFGRSIGHRKSSAQISHHYDPSTLVGRQVLAVVNLRPRQVGPFISEVLTVGIVDDAGHVVLFTPDKRVPNGSRLF